MLRAVEFHSLAFMTATVAELAPPTAIHAEHQLTLLMDAVSSRLTLDVNLRDALNNSPGMTAGMVDGFCRRAKAEQRTMLEVAARGKKGKAAAEQSTALEREGLV